jgi:putative restriction endonuclease
MHPKILEESDGPMLRHRQQGVHGSPLVLPASRRDQPNPERLRERYERYLSVA